MLEMLGTFDLLRLLQIGSHENYMDFTFPFSNFEEGRIKGMLHLQYSQKTLVCTQTYYDYNY